MPKITKQVISKYIKTDCKRFLALSLYRSNKDKELVDEYCMPEPIVARPSATIFAKAGKKAEELLYDLIEKEFKEYVINFKGMGNRYERLLSLFENDLENKLFLLEPEFITDAILEKFLNNLGTTGCNFKDKVDISDIRPDMIVKVIPNPEEIYYKVCSDGTLIKLDSNDKIMLSIIDVKNTEKSNSGYDAEIVLYAVLLTIWLEENSLSDKYVVINKNGIFPAALKVNAFTNEYESLESSSLDDKYSELLEYIEYIEFDQITISLKRIFIDDIVPILDNPNEWDNLDWHISKKCGLCDWLAYEEWLSEENQKKITDKHCLVNALGRDHLSQIPFISSAMRKVLENDNICTLTNIERTNGEEETYAKHSKLKVDSFIIPKRANAISSNRVLNQDRLIYSFPKYALTNIFITLNFDPSTRLVSSISTKCYWREFSPYGVQGYDNYRSFPSTVFFTEEGDKAHEREMLFLFLNQLNEYFEYANSSENNSYPGFSTSNYHMFFWDRTEFEELKKLIGKHIGVILQNDLFQPLIWLFGTEDILEDFANIKTPRVSFIKDVIKSNLALNIRFDYTLFPVAKSYTEFNLEIPKAFNDPFSDYIPKERLYEIWLKHKNYQETKDRYRRTAKSQVDALQFIAVKLQQDLRPLLKGTPTDINFDVFESFKGIKYLPVDSKLWYLHQRLNEEYSCLDNELDSFKNVNELEANYKAIVLLEQIIGKEKLEYIDVFGLPKHVFVYRVNEESKNSKIKDESSFLTFGSFSDFSIINMTLGHILSVNEIDFYGYDWSFWAPKKKVKDFLKMNIVHFDRQNGLIALEFSYSFGVMREIVQLLLDNNIIDLNSKSYLIDGSTYKSSKHSLSYLKAIKTPLVSYADEKTIKSIGLTKDIKGKKTHGHTMAADVLWNAKSLHAIESEFLEEEISYSYKEIISSLKYPPNEKQEEAIFNSIGKRLSIIWGPPGTGKTATASVLIKILLDILINQQKNKNILLSAFTYQACVEIFKKFVESGIDEKLKNINFYALKSKGRIEFLEFLSIKPEWMNLEIIEEDEDLKRVKANIVRNSEINIIISPTAALNKFYNDSLDSKKLEYNTIGEYIDFALLDESSQCDIVNSLSVLYGLKKDAQLVILGDHLQMPPIHQVKPPVGIEYNVGSLLEYLIKRHQVKPIMLNTNYRSLKDIVSYVETLGYDKLYCKRELSNITMNKNKDILENIYKKEFNCNNLYEQVMDTNNEVMAITYLDGVSSQANLFEAKLVSSLIIEAYNKFFDEEKEDYDNWFWTKGIGIVTPHKAQKVQISRLLENIFPDNKKLIDQSIDTVEKFQGSQRQFVIVSFGVGDPEIIAEEEEFLLNLNRTNVAISRAEDKVLVLISDELVHHLPDDKEVIKTSKAIKGYVYQYCNSYEKYILCDEDKEKNINLRIHI